MVQAPLTSSGSGVEKVAMMDVVAKEDVGEEKQNSQWEFVHMREL
jgi:hypothetical protein